MTVEMKKYKLGDIADFNKQTLSKKDPLDIIEYLDTSNLTENVFGSKQILSRKEAPSRAQRRVFDKTILYSTVRPRLKHYGFVESPSENTIVSTGFATIDVKDEFKNKIDAYYLYLLLIQDKITEYLGTVADTAVSAYPSLNPSDIQMLEFEFPNILVQNKVASILYNIDKRIENLRAQNRVLEQTAKAIYDYTFLQCAGHQTTYNKTLNRNIPTTWDVKKMKSVCKVVLGGTPSTKRDDYWQNGTVNWLNSGEVAEFPIIECEKTITKKAVEESSTVFLPKGSVTLSITRYLRPSILAIDACINQSVAGILENEIVKRSYLYPLLKVEVPKLNALRGGAQQPHINKEIVENIDIVIPPKNVLDRYYSDVDPIYEKILVNSEHLKALTTQRNTLLPLLMTGQIEI